jgi:hypothetical protein
MIGGSVSKIGIQTTKDVTPFILNSANSITDFISPYFENASFKIHGISQNIKIKISYNNTDDTSVYYTVSSQVGNLSSIEANQLQSYIAPDGIINLINGNYLIIGIYNNSQTVEDKQIDILNNSSGDAAITTINGNVIT